LEKANLRQGSYLTAVRNLKILLEKCVIIENALREVTLLKVLKIYYCAVAILSEADIITFNTHKDLYKYFNFIIN
jgi:hypothetical protein